MRVIALLAVVVGVVSALPWDPVKERKTRQCNCGWVNKGRIVGGQETRKNEYPFIAILETSYGGGVPFCGGTILTQWHVISAAHCTEDEKPNMINIRVGAHDVKQKQGTVHQVAKIIEHQWDRTTSLNDIVILVTKTPIRFDQNVGPACLPAVRKNLAGQTLTALGWGNTKNNGMASPVLLGVNLKVITFEECKKRWAGMPFTPRKETNLCTYEVRKDTCQGDSGGPLVRLNPETKRYSLVALVSYGGECGGIHPAVNTDVGSYLDWIHKKIAASKPGAAACTKG